MYYLIIILFCVIAGCCITIFTSKVTPQVKALASVAIVANAVVSGVTLGLLSKFM